MRSMDSPEVEVGNVAGDPMRGKWHAYTPQGEAVKNNCQ